LWSVTTHKKKQLPKTIEAIQLETHAFSDSGHSLVSSHCETPKIACHPSAGVLAEKLGGNEWKFFSREIKPAPPTPTLENRAAA
jgi:hypothetical protein